MDNAIQITVSRLDLIRVLDGFGHDDPSDTEVEAFCRLNEQVIAEAEQR
jgi:hypothetical protein